MKMQCEQCTTRDNSPFNFISQKKTAAAKLLSFSMLKKPNSKGLEKVVVVNIVHVHVPDRDIGANDGSKGSYLGLLVVGSSAGQVGPL